MISLQACRQEQQADPRSLGAQVGEYVQVVVEIPAGTNQKIEFDYKDGTFKVDQIDGKDRVIDFLPYPGNYGFVPGTLMDKERGGDGDAAAMATRRRWRCGDGDAAMATRRRWRCARRGSAARSAGDHPPPDRADPCGSPRMPAQGRRLADCRSGYRARRRRQSCATRPRRSCRVPRSGRLPCPGRAAG